MQPEVSLVPRLSLAAWERGYLKVTVGLLKQYSTLQVQVRICVSACSAT